MKKDKVNYICLAFAFVLFVLMCVIGNGRKCFFENRTKYDGADYIKMEFENTSEGFCYEFSLPENDVAGKYLSYVTYHFSSEVYIDGEKVYECRPLDPSKSKSTGYRWNFVELYENDAGKQVQIYQFSPYSKNSRPKEELFIGKYSDIFRAVFGIDGMRVIIAVVIFFIGIFLLMYSVLILKNKNINSLPVSFSVFSIFLSIWAMTGSRVFALLKFNTFLVAVLDHYSLMFMAIIFLQFIRQIYASKDSILWDIVNYAGIGVLIVRTMLDLLKISELRATLWMTHVHIVLFAVVGIVFGISEFASHKATKQFKFNIVCLVFIFMATFAEILVLNLFNKDSMYGIFCFMIYVALMSLNILNQSQEIKKRADEAEIYHKLAFIDELTGVFNRTAFRADMEKQTVVNQETGESEILPSVIFIFDLNDLKKCNDQFGHENGDIYITSVSKIISETFDTEGKCYRIGGDEFSVLMPFTDRDKIKSKIQMIQSKVQELNDKKFVVTMSVASGYAIYDEKTDNDLEATMKRADKMMYEDKKRLKQKLAAVH